MRVIAVEDLGRRDPSPGAPDSSPEVAPMLPPLLFLFLDRLHRPCGSPRRWCGLQSQARHKRCQHEAKNQSPHIFFSDSKLGLAAQLTLSSVSLNSIPNVI